jgi:hypothetical protein
MQADRKPAIREAWCLLAADKLSGSACWKNACVSLLQQDICLNISITWPTALKDFLHGDKKPDWQEFPAVAVAD